MDFTTNGRRKNMAGLKMKLNILSLFDGISCARIAVERAGFKVGKYYASEIDKYSIAISKSNYPDIVRLGKVENIQKQDFNDTQIDLLIGGSPCQDLSIAGKGKGLKGERSILFWEYLRLLRDVDPKYFIFENVASMKKKDRDVITKELGVIPIMIDAALVSAQQRKRLFWTNINVDELPEDKNIVLQNILEGDALTDRLKAYCIDQSYYKGASWEYYQDRSRRQMVIDFDGKEEAKKGLKFIGGLKHKNWSKDGKSIPKDCPQGYRVYSPEGKAVTLASNAGGVGAKTGLYYLENPVSAAIRGRDKDGKKMQMLETSASEKSNCLTQIQTDSLIAYNGIVRKLTPIECERLQGVPDNYTLCPHPVYKNRDMSDSRRYMVLGNAFNVDVIVHILSYIKEFKNV